MGTALRLLWKNYRFELAAVIVAFGLLIVGSIVQSARLEAVKPTPACWSAALAAEDLEEDFSRADCPPREPWSALNRQASQLGGIFTYLPVLAGALLGSVLVSREVEQRTTTLAWSLGPSRRRWLLERVLPVAILFALLLIGLAIAADMLEGGSTIGVDTRASLGDYGNRDIALVARGLGAFGIAVLVGALVGRQLPALIVSGVLALVLLVGINGAFPFGVEPRVLSRQEESAGQIRGFRTSLLMRRAYQRPDGTLLSLDEAVATVPDPDDQKTISPWLKDNFDRVALAFTGDQFDDLQVREAALLGIILLLSIGGAFVVIERREPS